MSAPRFQLARPHEIREIASGGAILRVLVGEMGGVRSPIETCSPVSFVEARSGDAAAEVPLQAPNGARAILFVQGSGAVDGVLVDAGSFVVLSDGAAPVLDLAPHTIAVIVGGVYLGRRYLEGNFIASTEARLDATLRRMRASGF